MISEREYFEQLSKLYLDVNEEMFWKMKQWKHNFCLVKEDNYDEKLMDFLGQIEEKYEFNMQPMYKTNYQLITLWQKEFMGIIQPDWRSDSLKFLIACCLTDKILDSRRFKRSEQENLAKRLEEVKENLFDGQLGLGFYELDVLFTDVFRHLKYRYTENDRADLMEKIKAALHSECFLWEHPLIEKEKTKAISWHLLTDKSIAFEYAALMLSLLEVNYPRANDAAMQIANILWLTDDLCDFIDDVKNRRRNSLLFMVEEKGVIHLEQRCEMVMKEMNKFITLLNLAIQRLRNLVGDDLFYYVIGMNYQWFEPVRTIIKN